MRRTLSAVLLLLALAGAGCAQNRIVYAQSGVQVQPPQYPSYQGSYTNGAIPSAWLPLYQRLRADGLDGPDLPALFASMGTPSQDPMGRKIKELYTKAFAPKPKPTPPSSKPTTPARPKPLVYPGVITAENVEKCRAFLEANKSAFDYAERTFGVPRQISVSLLFVETRLGTFLGKEKAFYTLASMASSRRPEAISTYVAQLPGSTAADRQSWIQQRMEQRSDWAYKELVALLKNIRVRRGRAGHAGLHLRGYRAVPVHAHEYQPLRSRRQRGRRGEPVYRARRRGEPRQLPRAARLEQGRDPRPEAEGHQDL